MDDSYALYSTLHFVITILLILVLFGVLGAILFRFKKTIAGILMAAGYGGVTVTVLLAMVTGRIVEPGGTASMVVFGLFDVLDFIFTILIAVGIFLIPKSLRIIRQSQGG